MIDERFVLHRYKASSHAAVVAAVLLASFFLWDFYGHGTVRVDLLTTLCAMAIVKVAAMIYYRRTE